MAFLYKRGQTWWIGWRTNGRLFRETTKTSEKARAEKKLHEFNALEQMHADGRLSEAFIEVVTGKQTPKTTFKIAVNDWLAECKGSTAPATYEKYATLTNELSEFLKASDTSPLLRDVTSDDIRAFLSSKREKITASTANVYRTILSSFFKRAMENRQIRENPIILIKPFKAGRDESLNRQAFTPDQLRLIFKKAPNDFWRYMILGAYSTGLRLGDLATMPWGAVDLSEGRINILTRKTGKQIKISITAPFNAILNKLHSEAKNPKPKDSIWPERAKQYEQFKAHQFSAEFYEILLSCGLASPRNHKATGKGRNTKREFTGLSFHSFRHTFVSTLKSTGATAEVAKALVGHSSDEINQVYTHLPEHLLDNAVDQLPDITK